LKLNTSVLASFLKFPKNRTCGRRLLGIRVYSKTGF